MSFFSLGAQAGFSLGAQAGEGLATDRVGPGQFHQSGEDKRMSNGELERKMLDSWRSLL